MSWAVRHEGSPASVDLTIDELHEQLVDGVWEPTDEVRGPGEGDWQAIENHPALAEVAADLEAPPARPYDDETRLDMTALIDVTLVLLVFFILTTTVAALQKIIDAPAVSKDKAGTPVYTREQVANQMIHVKVTMEGGYPVYRVEDKVVEEGALADELGRFVRSTSKTKLLLEHDDRVTHDSVVQVIDAARKAGLDGVNLLVP